MRRMCLALLVLAAAGCGGDDDGGEPPAATLTATATATETATPAPAEDCGQVGFTPQTDHGAFQIEAQGTSCDTARAVATAAEGESGSYSAEGFDCSGEVDTDAALRSTAWTCTSGDATVTFVTS